MSVHATAKGINKEVEAAADIDHRENREGITWTPPDSGLSPTANESLHTTAAESPLVGNFVSRDSEVSSTSVRRGPLPPLET